MFVNPVFFFFLALVSVASFSPVNWKLYGSAVVVSDSLVLSSGQSENAGSFWSSTSAPAPAWEAQVTFFPSGDFSRAGSGDGFALWHSLSSSEHPSGPYGNFYSEGIAAIVDLASSPRLLLYRSAGSVSRASEAQDRSSRASIGENIDSMDGILGSCNLPTSSAELEKGITIRLRYEGGGLTLDFLQDPTKKVSGWKRCCIAPRAHLPASGYFGLTANNGKSGMTLKASDFRVRVLGTANGRAEEDKNNYQGLEAGLERLRGALTRANAAEAAARDSDISDNSGMSGALRQAAERLESATEAVDADGLALKAAADAARKARSHAVEATEALKTAHNKQTAAERSVKSAQGNAIMQKRYGRHPALFVAVFIMGGICVVLWIMLNKERNSGRRTF